MRGQIRQYFYNAKIPNIIDSKISVVSVSYLSNYTDNKLRLKRNFAELLVKVWFNLTIS